ncbi:hypothetical protein RHMOL_Rhmol03G0023300 [Rhododendron molle]|uniref:Uncharacterized protein n=1 Tax=Rhododendron molle TaxID=49168 RepID=A0ACC0PC60_RHOML|nr:hypothetical protein RHMOL_Rhmol03G0023300 [Rhododendron molle]
MIFLKIVATGGEISVSTYSIVLKNLLAAGNWRKYIEVTTSNFHNVTFFLVTSEEMHDLLPEFSSIGYVMLFVWISLMILIAFRNYTALVQLSPSN